MTGLRARLQAWRQRVDAEADAWLADIRQPPKAGTRPYSAPPRPSWRGGPPPTNTQEAR